jgi:hypothetical protein
MGFNTVYQAITGIDINSGVAVAERRRGGLVIHRKRASSTVTKTRIVPENPDGLNPPHLNAALSTRLALNVDLYTDALGHFLDMGNDANLPALGLQVVERIHGHAQGVGIQTTEPFVDKQGLDPHPVRG